MASRFGVDTQQAQRVAKLACTLYGQLQTGSGVAASEVTRQQRKLNWAGQLHELAARSHTRTTTNTGPTFWSTPTHLALPCWNCTA